MSQRNLMGQNSPVIRLISFVLVFLMLLSSVPVNVFAQNNLGSVSAYAGSSPSPSLSPLPMGSSPPTSPPPSPTGSSPPSGSPSPSPKPSGSPSSTYSPSTPTPIPVHRPSLVTDPASDIQPTSACLSGSLLNDGGGEITDAGFNWFSNTGSGKAHTGSGLSYALTGLTPNTIYTYQAFATNSAGTSYGGYMTFKTPSLPLAVTTLEATDIGFDRVTLNGQSSGGENTFAFGFCILSPSVQSVSAYPDPSGSFSTVVQGLKPGVTYSFTAYSTDAHGILYGSTLSFTTLTAVPKVDTQAPTDINITSATLNGNVLDKGSSDVIDSGFLWGKDSKPGNKVIYSHGNLLGLYNSLLNSLEPNTTYYIQAYASNAEGTGYGQVVSFKTLKGDPVVESWDAGAVNAVSANLGAAIPNGAVLKALGLPVTDSGFIWGLNPKPDQRVSARSDADLTSFSYDLKGLKPNTTYYFQAFAKNSVSTAYSKVFSFTTSPGLPEVTTWPAESISPVYAVIEGDIQNAGDLKSQGLPITDSGFLWGTDPNPIQKVSVSPDQTGERLYHPLNDLKDDTIYYYRAFATNSVGTSYGEVLSFTTPNGDPEVETRQPDAVNPVGASLQGVIVKNKGLPITDSGFLIGTDSKPGQKVSCIPGAGGRLTSVINDLKQDTTYYFQAYATNAAGTGYGEVVSFTTPNGDPVVVAYPVDVINPIGAKLVAGIEDDKGLPITESGFLWGTGEKPDQKVSADFSPDTNEIFYNLKDLKEDTTYYFQAYASNAAGTGYSEVLSFTTPNGDPIVETQEAANIEPTRARFYGSVKDNKGLDILDAGFMWGINEKPDQKVSVPFDTNTKSFNAFMQELQANTTYYFQAYAVNAAGTGYGEVKQFTTATYAPIVETRGSGNITSVSANLNGFVLEDYGFKITESGFFWGTDPKPDNKVTSPLPGNPKLFSLLLGKLRGDTTYYVQAYAMSAEGIGYGKVLSFKTSPSIKPAVATLTADFDSENWQPVLKGSITSNGGDPITSYGFRYGTDQRNWTLYTVGQSDFDGDFSTTVAGGDKLPPGTYYVQAFATNSIGTSYGASVKFTTPLPPSVACSASSPAVGATTAVLTGNITDTGWTGVSCDMRQFQYRKAGTAEWQIAGAEQGAFEAGTFTFTLEGLEPGASYEFIAQAGTPAGLGSSPIVKFTAGWGQDDREAAKNMKSAGYGAAKIAGILKDVYKDTAEAAFGALQYASYEVNDIVSVLKASAYRMAYTEAVRLMKGSGFDVYAVTGMLRKIYPNEMKDLADGYYDYYRINMGAAKCLKNSGYGIDDILSVMRTLYNYQLSVCMDQLGPKDFYNSDELYGGLIRSFGGNAVAGYIWNKCYKGQSFWTPWGKMPVLGDIAKILRKNGNLSAWDVAQAFKAVYPTIGMEEIAGGLAEGGFDINTAGETVTQLYGNDVQALAKALLSYTGFTPSAIEDYLIKNKNASAQDMVKVICNVFSNNFRSYEEIPRVLSAYYNMDAGSAAEAMYSAGYSLDYLLMVIKNYYHLTAPGDMMDIFVRIGLSSGQVIERAENILHVRNDWLPAFRLHGFSAADYCSYVKANPGKMYGPNSPQAQSNLNGQKAQAGSIFAELARAGYSPFDIAVAVKSIYNFDQTTLLNIFADANNAGNLYLNANDIVAAVDKAYGANSITAAIKAMRDGGSSAVQAALTLKNSYGITDPEKAADYLAQAGFDENGTLDGLEVAYYDKSTVKETIEKLYQTDLRIFGQNGIRAAIDAILRTTGRGMDAVNIVRLLNDDGYSVKDISGILRNGYSLASSQIIDALVSVLGNSRQTEIAAGVASVFTEDIIPGYVQVLKNKRYYASQVLPYLTGMFGVTDPVKVADYLNQAGYSQDEVLDTLEAHLLAGKGDPEIIKTLADVLQKVYNSEPDDLSAIFKAYHATYPSQMVGIMKDGGYSITDIFKVLMQSMGVSPDQVIEAMKQCGYQEKDIIPAMQAAFGAKNILANIIKAAHATYPSQAIDVLKKNGYGLADILGAIRSSFGLTADQAIRALQEGGYPVNDIIQAIQAEYGGDHILADLIKASGATYPSQAIQVLKNNGYGLTEILRAIKDAFGLTSDQAIDALKQAGYQDKEIIPAIQVVYGGDHLLTDIIKASHATYPSQAVSVLKNDGYALTDILRAIKDAFGLASDQAIDALKQGGYLDTEIIPAIQLVYGGGHVLTDLIKASHFTYPSQAVQQLKQDGYGIVDITGAIKDSFGLTSDQAIEALKQGGYGNKDIIPAIQTIYGGSNVLTDLLKASHITNPSQAVTLLQQNDYSIVDIARALKDAFGLTSDQAIEALKQGGYQEKDIISQVQAVYAGDYVLSFIKFWQNYRNDSADGIFNLLGTDLGIQDPVKKFLYLKTAGYSEDDAWWAIIHYAYDDVFQVLRSLYAPGDPIALATLFKQIPPLKQRYTMMTLIQGLRDSFPGVSNTDIIKSLRAAGYVSEDITGWLRTYVEDGKHDDALAAILGSAYPDDLGLRTVDAAEILYYKGYSIKESAAWLLKDNYKWEDFFAYLVNNYTGKAPDAAVIVRELKGVYGIDDLARGVLGYMMHTGGTTSPGEFEYAWVYTHLRNGGYSVEETVRQIVKMGATGVSSLIAIMYEESITIANENNNQNLRYSATYIAQTLYTIGLTTPGVSFSLTDIARGLVESGPNAAGGFACFSKLEIYYAMQFVTAQYLAAHGSGAPVDITALYLLRTGGLCASDAAAILADDGVGLSTGDIIKSFIGIGSAWFDAVIDLYGAGYSFSDSLGAVYSNPDYHLVIGVSILATLATKAVTWLDDTGRVGDIIKAIKKVADLGFKVGSM